MDNLIVDKPVDEVIPLKDILELKLQGRTYQEIATKYKCSPQNIQQRIKGIYTLLDKESLDAYKANKANILDAVELELISKLHQSDKTKMNTLQLSTAYAIIFDKNRVNSNLSTENINIRGSITAIDARLAEIDKALADADTQPHESKE